MLPLLDRLEAMLVDVRLSPQSRVAHWQGSSLARICGRRRYVHLAEFGNLNYKNREPDQIEIADFQNGYEKIFRLLGEFPSLVLLCACDRFELCHRRVLSDKLTEAKFPTAEINNWETYPALF